MAGNNSKYSLKEQRLHANLLERQGIIWKHMGHALFSIQLFEFCISLYIVLLLHKRGDEIPDLLERSFAKTLGQLIKTLKDKKVPIPDGYECRLKVFITERNWLVHGLYIEYHDHFFSGVNDIKVFNRISALIDEANSLSRTFIELYQQWRYKQGVTKEQYDAEIKKGLSKIECSEYCPIKTK